MRAMMLLAALAVGCSKPASVPDDFGDKKTLAPTVGKIEASDLVRWYTGGGGKHKWEGERIVLKLPYQIWGAPDDSKKICLLWESGDGFRRPALIARANRTWLAGKKPSSLQSLSVSGQLVGFIPLASRPEFKSWVDLTPSAKGTGDYVVVLEDVYTVSE